MSAKDQLKQLKKQFERLRKESLKAVGTGNEAIYAGLQKFADKELSALNDYYKSALSSLKSSRASGDSIKDAVQTQFDLVQDTVTRLIGHARESLQTVIEASSASKSTVPPKKKSTVPPKKTPRSTVPPKRRARSTVPPKAKPKSTVPPRKKSTVPPKKTARSTVPPKRRAAVVTPSPTTVSSEAATGATE